MAQSVKQVDYLWFLINPLKDEKVKRRTVWDFAKIVSDNKDMSRKVIIDQVEDYIQGLQEEDDEYLNLVKVSFNYPGSKKAIIDFSKILNRA